MLSNSSQHFRRRSSIYDATIAGLYDLGETIGRGHFAVVKLARHVFTGEKVAVKVIDKNKLDPVSREHLFQEVRCMKLVQHPNIVRLYEVIDTQTKLFLILELGDYDLLDYLLKKHDQRLSEHEAQTYFCQIVQAISFCHKLHVVHRDLKPENVVFFEKLGMVKLTDFGFSNLFSPGQKLETSCGSLAYSAPELLLGDSYDAPAVDVWSLGVILYMLVCGELPFQEANDSETLTRILDCCYRLPAHLSDECKRLIASLLVRDPSDRATLDELAENSWVLRGDLRHAEHLPLVSRQHVTDECHDEILTQMANGGVAKAEDVSRALDADEYNYITATYYLLAERFLRKERHLQAASMIASKSAVMVASLPPAPPSTAGVNSLALSPRVPPKTLLEEPASTSMVQSLISPTLDPGGLGGRTIGILQEESEDETSLSSRPGSGHYGPLMGPMVMGGPPHSAPPVAPGGGAGAGGPYHSRQRSHSGEWSSRGPSPAGSVRHRDGRPGPAPPGGGPAISPPTVASTAGLGRRGSNTSLGSYSPGGDVPPSLASVGILLGGGGAYGGSYARSRSPSGGSSSPCSLLATSPPKRTSSASSLRELQELARQISANAMGMGAGGGAAGGGTASRSRSRSPSPRDQGRTSPVVHKYRNLPVGSRKLPTVSSSPQLLEISEEGEDDSSSPGGGCAHNSSGAGRSSVGAAHKHMGGSHHRTSGGRIPSHRKTSAGASFTVASSPSQQTYSIVRSVRRRQAIVSPDVIRRYDRTQGKSRRSASCSSSEASDDDSDKRFGLIAGHRGGPMHRRDDDEDPPPLGGSGGGPHGIGAPGVTQQQVNGVKGHGAGSTNGTAPPTVVQNGQKHSPIPPLADLSELELAPPPGPSGGFKYSRALDSSKLVSKLKRLALAPIREIPHRFWLPSAFSGFRKTEGGAPSLSSSCPHPSDSGAAGMDTIGKEGAEPPLPSESRHHGGLLRDAQGNAWYKFLLKPKSCEAIPSLRFSVPKELRGSRESNDDVMSPGGSEVTTSGQRSEVTNETAPSSSSEPPALEHADNSGQQQQEHTPRPLRRKKRPKQGLSTGGQAKSDHTMKESTNTVTSAFPCRVSANAYDNSSSLNNILNPEVIMHAVCCKRRF